MSDRNDAIEADFRPEGVWVAYYSDRSGVYPYRDEIDALRAAVDKCAQVKFVRWGDEVFDLQ